MISLVEYLSEQASDKPVMNVLDIYQVLQGQLTANELAANLMIKPDEATALQELLQKNTVIISNDQLTTFYEKDLDFINKTIKDFEDNEYPLASLSKSTTVSDLQINSNDDEQTQKGTQFKILTKQIIDKLAPDQKLQYYLWCQTKDKYVYLILYNDKLTKAINLV